jgi:hypothetical protein
MDEELALAAIRRAYATVPFYAKNSGPPLSGSLAEVLSRLPLLTREKMKPTLPKMWFPENRDARAELAAGSIALIEAGHSRVRVLFDPKAYRRDEARALALHPVAAGVFAEAHRDAVLWVPERGTGSCGAGDPSYEERLEGARLHLNSRQDPTFWTEPVMTRMLDELSMHGTNALLADPFYLDVLARHAALLNRRLDVRGFVALTRARGTAEHRAAIGRVYSGTVIDYFAAREVGPLLVGSTDVMRPASFSTHVELLPAKVETPGAEDVALVVVTTLEREVQPLVRYVLGDLVQRASGGCIRSVEGQLDDALVRADGAIVTSGAIDRAIDARGGACAYQITQREAAVEAEVVGDEAAVHDALAALLPGTSISVRKTTAIAVEPNGKYRTTRRLGPSVALGTTFEGAAA